MVMVAFALGLRLHLFASSAHPLTRTLSTVARLEPGIHKKKKNRNEWPNVLLTNVKSILFMVDKSKT